MLSWYDWDITHRNKLCYLFSSLWKYCYKKLALHNLDIRTIETENDIAASSKVVFLPFEMPEACFYDLTNGRHWPPFWCGGYCYLEEVKITAFFAIQLIPLVVNSIGLSSKIGRIFFISHIKQVTNSVSELKTVLWEYHLYFSFVLRLEFSTVSVNVFAVRLNCILKLVIQCWNVFSISCHWPVYHSFWWDTWRKYF